jgi:hypothetical protein
MHNHESKSFDASAQAFSDFRAMNCPANPTTHAEIAARYAEQARGAAKKQGRSRPPISLLRLAELERIFKDRWGKYVPDTPEGRDAVSVYCAHCAWHKSMDRFYGYVRVQVAWMPWDEAEAIADRESRSQWPDADALGWRLQLTPEERKRLGIGSIAPVGSSPRKRKTLRKAAARERMAGQRRREGATPRAEYEAASISGQKPWESLGWSRAKWYRKRSANAKTNAKSETSAFAPSSLDTPANGRVSPGPLNGLPLGGVNTSDGARATARPHTFKKTASQLGFGQF